MRALGVPIALGAVALGCKPAQDPPSPSALPAPNSVITTTANAFCENDGSRRLEEGPEGLRILEGLTPAKWPEEARTIADAAYNRIPIFVRVPAGKGQFIQFRVTGFADQQNLIIPCESRAECARIADAIGFVERASPSRP